MFKAPQITFGSRSGHTPRALKLTKESPASAKESDGSEPEDDVAE
jgi:hypothetical protein